MCLEPTTTMLLISAAMSAGSAVVAHQGQEAQADYTDQANDIARDQFALDEDLQRMDGERQRQQQYQQDASEMNAHEAEAMRERATLEALLGEYGAGNTGDRRLATLGVRQGQDLATLTDNASKRQQELGFSESAAIGSTRGKLASLRPSERPSKLGLGLQIGSATTTAGMRYHDIKNPRPGAAAGPGSASIERWLRNGSGGD